MERIIIINGSPRGVKSNSKIYGEIFSEGYKGKTYTFNITKNNYKYICEKIEIHTDVLLIFPLYADSMPVILLDFLKTFEQIELKNELTIHMVINCGFIEPEQNAVCIEMIKLFCKQNGHEFGSVLSIGGGEAILNTPFKYIVKRKIKKLANSIYNKKRIMLTTTMPLSKRMYINASTRYWINYGKRNGITKKQMEVMDIE